MVQIITSSILYFKSSLNLTLLPIGGFDYIEESDNELIQFFLAESHQNQSTESIGELIATQANFRQFENNHENVINFSS